MTEIDQHDLQRREDRIGKQNPQNPEQSAHQKLHCEQDGRREVDRPPRDIGDNHISIDIVHQEIEDDAPDPLPLTGAEAHGDHQHA